MAVGVLAIPRFSSRATSAEPPPVKISFSEIISALSFANDLTEGALPGHALRSCLLGMRIAQSMGVCGEALQSLYYALLLKDVGCSSNAARMCQIVGGDDRVLKSILRLHDWAQPHRPRRQMVRLIWRQVLPLAGVARRAERLATIAWGRKRNNREMIQMRCERGASIVRKLGLSEETSHTLESLDERWDGAGYPHQLKGTQIPLAARILAVAQHLDVFASEEDRDVAVQVMRARAGAWFDPEVVDAVLALEHNRALWSGYEPGAEALIAIRALVMALEPAGGRGVAEHEIDQICEAFAEVVDAKSPFTYQHSIGVARVSVRIAERLGLPAERVQLVRRAALLHDLGKLSIPNTILDKAGKLTAAEWEIVTEHSRLTRGILERIDCFAELAEIAGAHHERLDGSGYPEQLRGNQLNLESRILAVADAYQALTEGRPYSSAHSHSTAVAELRRFTPHQLDARCVDALG